MSDEKRGVSRRGLFGVFGKGLRSLKDGLEDVHRAHHGEPRRDASGSGEPPERPVPDGSYDRVVRPPEDIAPATAQYIRPPDWMWSQ